MSEQKPREWVLSGKFKYTRGTLLDPPNVLDVDEEVRVVESSALDALRAELAEARSGALMKRAVVVCDDLYKLSLERDALMAERDALRGALEGDKMPETFRVWFATNYPGPDTIIAKPDWHAPKIWRAAMRLALAASKEGTTERRAHPRMPIGLVMDPSDMPPVQATKGESHDDR